MTEIKSIELLKTLVSFDTISHNSNLELIEFVENYLKKFGVKSNLIYDSTGKKANLYATIGPKEEKGIILSGHTDVVPVNSKGWDSDPFKLNHIDDKLPILTRPIRLALGATKAVLDTKGFDSSKLYFFIFCILNKSRFKNIKI